MAARKPAATKAKPAKKPAVKKVAAKKAPARKPFAKKPVAVKKPATTRAKAKKAADDKPKVSQEKAIKDMIKRAKERGYISHAEVNKILPAGEIPSEKIEDIMAMLSEMGINVVEEDPDEDTEEPKKKTETDEFETTKKT